MIKGGHGDRSCCSFGIRKRRDDSHAQHRSGDVRVVVLAAGDGDVRYDHREHLMSLNDFLSLQSQLMDAFGWLIRWWLIGLIVGGVFAAIITWTLITTREMVSKI